MTRLRILEVRSDAIRALAQSLLIAPWLMFSAVTLAEHTCPDECSQLMGMSVGGSLEYCDATPMTSALSGLPGRRTTPIIASQIGDPDAYLYSAYLIPIPGGGASAGCSLTQNGGLIENHVITNKEVWACIRELNDYCRSLGL